MIAGLPNEPGGKVFAGETQGTPPAPVPNAEGGVYPVSADANVEGEGVGAGAQPSDADFESDTLLAITARENLRLRWSEIQESFVDDPKRAVENADQLVGEAMRRLSEVFQDTRHRLEKDWRKGDESVSTEHLRQALRRYRTFFDQILAV